MKMARLTRNAIEILSTAVGLTPKLRPMVGRATLTMVTSMMLMNIAATNTTLTATFWLIRDSKTFLSSGLPAAFGNAGCDYGHCVQNLKPILTSGYSGHRRRDPDSAIWRVPCST